MTGANGIPVSPPIPIPQTECLLDIEEAELRLLCSLYRDNEHNPYAGSLLVNGLRVREMVKGYPLKFMSPLGVWRDNGTFIASVEYSHCVEVSIFTLNPQNLESCTDAIFSGLNFTKRINFESHKKPVIFKEIHEKFVPLIKRIIKKRHLQIEKEEKFHVFRMKKNDALQLEIRPTPEDANLELKPLDAIDSITIKRNWPHVLNAEDIPCTLIDVNGGYGIFQKADEKLISWGIKTMMGQIGFVQTLQDFQRKGYASNIVKTFAKEFASEGVHPSAVVPVNDIVPHNFFENIGFKKVGYCYNIHLKMRKDAIATDNAAAGEGSSKC